MLGQSLAPCGFMARCLWQGRFFFFKDSFLVAGLKNKEQEGVFVS